MRCRMLCLLVTVALVGGCGPSEPVQEDIDSSGNAPSGTVTAPANSARDMPLLEPDPKPDVNEPSEAADEIPLVEPQPQAEGEAKEDLDPAITDPPQANATTSEPGDETPGAGAQAPNEETAQAEPEQPTEEEGAADVEEEPKEPLVLAIEAVQGGDFGTAKGHLESVLMEDPNHRDALYLLAVTQLSEAVEHDRFGEVEKANPLFLEAGATLEKLQKAHPDLELPAQLTSRVRFDSARVHARSGNGDEAIAMLQAAVDAGFDQPDQLGDEADFESIRLRPEFETIVTNLREKLAARAEAEAKELLATHEPFDFSFTLKNLDGEAVSLKDYEGKVVLVDIWGTWCPPCRKEVPHLVELHKNYRDQGFEIVGINDERSRGLTAEEAPPVIREFADEFGITYTCVVVDDATLDKVPNFEGYPTKLLIDRSGAVRAKMVGYRSYDQLEAVVKLLLNESTAEGTRAGTNRTDEAD